MELIILCGGKGTRLQSVVSNVPKPLAPIGEKVFLDNLLDQYFAIGFKSITLSACYMADQIKEYAKASPYCEHLRVINEKVPLGTGGAIKHCLEHLPDGRYAIANGDTYIEGLSAGHLRIFLNEPSPVTIVGNSIDYMSQSRYGGFEINDDGYIVHDPARITNVNLISLGLYIVDRASFLEIDFPNEPFGIDNCIRSLSQNGTQVRGINLNSDFIDIGVPDDYRKFIEKHV